jgi:hypothetical protein
VAKAPEIEAVPDKHNEAARRAATRAALANGAPADDVAESLVAWSDEQLLAGNRAAVDACMFDAVHDGVPPSVLFEQIKRHAVRTKGAG